MMMAALRPAYPSDDLFPKYYGNDVINKIKLPAWLAPPDNGGADFGFFRYILFYSLQKKRF